MCVAGQQVSCSCVSGIVGAQACKDDGSGYLACACLTGGAGASDGGNGTNDGGASGSGTNDGGMSGDSSGSGTSGGGTSDGGTSDGGTSDGGTSDGGTSDGGTSDGGGAGASELGEAGAPVTCVTLGVARCTELAQCAPIALKAIYGDRATCEASATQECAAHAVPHAGGPNDAEACLAAISASCDSYFESVAHPPAACRDKPGAVPDQGACGYDAQCGQGEGCDLSQAVHPDPACQQGRCTQRTAHGGTCTQDSDCDSRTGDRCVPDTGTCQTVAYGVLGAACADGTTKECQTGFYCSPDQRCAALLGANSACAGSDCDSRLGLYCQGVPESDPVSHVCAAPTYVPSGAQCGLVDGTAQDCSGTSYCDSLTAPSTCKPRVAQGQGCVAAIRELRERTALRRR